MNAVGECVCRVDAALSCPAGESAPPITFTSGDTDLSASYAVASSSSYDRAARSTPFAPNCGIQKRLRFGSFPITKSVIAGNARAIDAAYCANSPRARDDSGAVLPSRG